MNRERGTRRNTRLSLFARLTAGATLVLIVAGGLVTSTESGLAVPDWPLSYGMLFPPMVGGILYEHGHRMIAGTVAILTLVLAVWLHRAEPRRWVRRLGAAALGTVVLQALLGGLTVLFLLPLPISVAHACLGQTFFCLVVTIALVVSREWRDGDGKARAASDGRAGGGHATLVRLGVATTALVYAQLLLGALVRHSGAALAIPDFPLALGRVVPPLNDRLVAIHFAHRVGALAVGAAVAALVARVFASRTAGARVRATALRLAALMVAQIGLGAATVWSRTAVAPATAHVAVGAGILATALVLTLRAARAGHEAAAARAAAPAPAEAAERASLLAGTPS
jgi:cytochrome c oxidase assembly protein subunit 15